MRRDRAHPGRSRDGLLFFLAGWELVFDTAVVRGVTGGAYGRAISNGREGDATFGHRCSVVTGDLEVEGRDR